MKDNAQGAFLLFDDAHIVGEGTRISNVISLPIKKIFRQLIKAVK